jgi:hypothetical protein
MVHPRLRWSGFEQKKRLLTAQQPTMTGVTGPWHAVILMWHLIKNSDQPSLKVQLQQPAHANLLINKLRNQRQLPLLGSRWPQTPSAPCHSHQVFIGKPASEEACKDMAWQHPQSDWNCNRKPECTFSLCMDADWWPEMIRCICAHKVTQLPVRPSFQCMRRLETGNRIVTSSDYRQVYILWKNSDWRPETESTCAIGRYTFGRPAFNPLCIYLYTPVTLRKLSPPSTWIERWKQLYWLNRQLRTMDASAASTDDPSLVQQQALAR